MANTVIWIQAKTGDDEIDYDGTEDRKLIGAMFPIEGVLGNGELKVTPRAAGANMSVDVAPGGAAVTNDWVTNGGAYLSFEDATVNVPIPSAPSSGSRTHLIVEQVRDPQVDGQSSYASAPICIPDNGGGAQLPKSAYLLAQVTVSAGTASITAANITDMRTQASGPPPFTRGNFSATTSSNGRVTIPHLQDTRPVAAFLTLNATSNTYIPFKVSIASDVVTWELRTTSGNLAASGQSVSGDWHVDR